MFSLVIPVFKNEENLDRLLTALSVLAKRLDDRLEVVFVVDGSPDRCYEILGSRLPQMPVRSQLLLLTRNFGSFAAILAGLAAAQGEYLAVMAADLQEPPSLAEEIFRRLQDGDVDVVFGVRKTRKDPWLTRVTSQIFWGLFRKLVLRDMPPGGVDVFGCHKIVRDSLLQLRETQTNLIALLFWMGYRRAYIPYDRQARIEGKSAWTMGKRIRYLLDSIFNFTDLPIKLLLCLGAVSLLLSVLGMCVIIGAKLVGTIKVPGYAATAVLVLSLGALLGLGMGVLGQYLWLTLQNARGRPAYLVHKRTQYSFNDPT